MKPQTIGVGLLSLALGVATTRAQEQQSGAPTAGEINPLSVTCTYAIGGFACVSTTGNVASFKNMAGVELLNVPREAYGLCDASANRVSLVGGTFGFEAPTTISSSGTAVTIEQLTTDGVFKLRHAWKADKKARDLTVTNTITNMSATARTNVKFIRTMHHPIANFTAAFDRASNSAWLRWIASPSVAITATALPPDNSPTHAAHVTKGGISSACEPLTPFATPGTASSSDGFNTVSLPIQHLIGSLGAGNKVIVTTVYRQQ